MAAPIEAPFDGVAKYSFLLPCRLPLFQWQKSLVFLDDNVQDCWRFSKPFSFLVISPIFFPPAPVPYYFFV